jgi:CSLREA domain-containing protein
VLAACGEDQPPTAPTAPAEQGDQASSHAAGHKVVTSLADPGDGACTAAQCTLREAINDPGSTEISFAPGLTGAITLARSGAGGGTLVIDKALTITGPSAGIVIRRRSTDPDFRIFRILLGATVKLTNLAIHNGKTDGGGGGIVNFGTLALANCTVAGNSAAGGGGGIHNHGTLTLRNTTVKNNSSGIRNRVGTLTLANSTVAGNSGTGISNVKGTLALTHSTVAHNSSRGITNSGGQAGSTATLTEVRITDNGGGISNGGKFMLTNSTVARNGGAATVGGGVANGTKGTFTIINSTIAGNSATDRGGGIFNENDLARVGARVSLTNSTVSGNLARLGGGIYNSATRGDAIVGLNNSTVAFNSASQGGGGIHQEEDADEGIVGLRNSLVAQNSAPTGPDVLDSDPESEIFEVIAFFSLIGDSTGSGMRNLEGNQAGNASAPIDPRLGPLADNGGPTRTHALLLGSPAIDAASTPDCPTTDQRGVLRPQGAACDIGSYERR